MDKSRITKNEGRPDVSSIKRLYIPGLVVESRCPKCGWVQEYDFEDEYVSYLGESVDETDDADQVELGCWCKRCENEWTTTVKIKIRVTAEVVKEP